MPSLVSRYAFEHVLHSFIHITVQLIAPSRITGCATFAKLDWKTDEEVLLKVEFTVCVDATPSVLRQGDGTKGGAKWRTGHVVVWIRMILLWITTMSNFQVNDTHKHTHTPIKT